MKKIFVIALSMFLALTSLNAETPKQIARQRKQIEKLSRTELNARASREARKAARKYGREGWTVPIGALPLEKQLDQSYMMHYEYDENLIPKYVFGEATSVGAFYDSAVLQANESARLNLASNIQSEVNALIESTLANQQIDAQDAESISRVVSANKDKISARLGRLLTVVECQRTTKTGKIEVRKVLAYSAEQAFDIARAVIREGLEAEGIDLHDKLDTILGK